jgi:hypothetical protein
VVETDLNMLLVPDRLTGLRREVADLARDRLVIGDECPRPPDVVMILLPLNESAAAAPVEPAGRPLMHAPSDSAASSVSTGIPCSASSSSQGPGRRSVRRGGRKVDRGGAWSADADPAFVLSGDQPGVHSSAQKACFAFSRGRRPEGSQLRPLYDSDSPFLR